MNVDTLKEKLADIDADTLRNFVFDLYLRYPQLSGKIEALAKRIKVFKPLPTHHAFVQQLHAAHGRKKSFWARLES